jgi:putative endonuclease
VTGQEGERLALEYLQAKGYSLVQSNFRTRFGEIDIIVKNGEYLVFAEVKTRKNSRFALGAEAVDARKRRKLILTASGYLALHATRLQPRFDVIEVYAQTGRINHIIGAFTG